MAFSKRRTYSEKDVISELENRLSELIPNLSIIETRREVRIGSNLTADLIITTRTGDIVKQAVVEVKYLGEPRLAQLSIEQLKQLTKKLSDCYPIFAAPYVSRRAREICREAGVGYLDLAGNVYISFDSVLIDRVGPNESQNERENTRSMLAPKATRVIRELVDNPNQVKRIKQLADQLKMSPGGVYFVIKLLETKGYLERTSDRGIKVVEPRKLLLDWAANWTVHKSKASMFFSFDRRPEEIMKNVTEAAKRLKLKYAFTCMAGASLVSPFVRYEDVWFYVEGNKDLLIRELDLRPVSTGANVVILEPYDAGVFTGVRKLQTFSVVSNSQLFVDLYNYPSRGREQAERLLETSFSFGGRE